LITGAFFPLKKGFIILYESIIIFYLQTGLGQTFIFENSFIVLCIMLFFFGISFNKRLDKRGYAV